jgi:hypothetical protein
MNPDDPWAAPSDLGQGDPPAAPPPGPAAQHTADEPRPLASTGAPERPEPGGHRPATTAETTTCYLLHFDRPYIGANGKGVAKHYTGSAINLAARLAEH